MSRLPTLVALGVVAAGVAFLVLVALHPRPPEPLPAPKAVRPPPPRPKSREALLRDEPLGAPFDGLKLLAEPKREPGPMDWLAQHPEDGQSFTEFKRLRKAGEGKGGVIYFVPVGAMTPAQAKVLDRAIEVTAAYYQATVKRLPPLSAQEARALAVPRQNDFGEQWLSPALIAWLAKHKPKDAVGLVGITATDLYPDPEWNFVFGQADYEVQVGIMSMARYGDPAQQPVLTARRLSQVAAHELGHMFGVLHCTTYECAMNGSNHQAESDAAPLEPCPTDTAKFVWYFGLDPLARAKAVQRVYADAGFTGDADFAEREAEALAPAAPAPPR